MRHAGGHAGHGGERFQGQAFLEFMRASNSLAPCSTDWMPLRWSRIKTPFAIWTNNLPMRNARAMVRQSARTIKSPVEPAKPGARNVRERCCQMPGHTPQSNLASLRLAADIGGTFTDVAAFDQTNKRLLLGKSLSTPRAMVQGIEAGRHQGRHHIRGSGPFSARLDSRDQHDAGAHRRQNGVGDDARISRRLRDRTDQSARRLQSVLPETFAAGAAPDIVTR